MSNLNTDRLLGFAKKLQHVNTFAQLLAEAREEVHLAAGYAHSWLLVADEDDPDLLLVVEVAGAHEDLVRSTVPTLDVKNDSFLKAIVTSDVPVVVVDARIDPRTNKEIVAKLQNRTLINIPLRLLDEPLGIFGLGTFGDEGCRAPTEEELNYFVGMGAQISVAAGRIQYAEMEKRAQRERIDMEHKLSQIQRLESLGLLAGGVAHDFNNLLTVIVSSLSMAAKDLVDLGPLGESILSDVQLAAEAADRASKLTRQLLAMGRNQNLDFKPLQINDHLRTLVGLLQRILPENIEVVFIAKRELPIVPGDASQLDQVFMNLCLNSRDAMPDGGKITIETETIFVNGKYVQTHPWAKPGEYVLITVSDTGKGIPREVIDKIFDPFFTTKSPDRGTGLGLSVSYGVIRQHDGMIHCYSEVDRGTVFRIYLPITELTRDSSPPDSNPSEVAGTERILVVEDDTGVLQIARRILEGAGYVVTAASNGREALDCVATATFDLVILDMVTPGLTSEDVLDKLRANALPLQVILSSGYSAEAKGLRDLVQKTGHPLLSKPYDPDALLRAVRRALKGPST